jgi:predicted porin
MQNSFRKNTLALAALLAIGGTVLSTSASAQTAVAVPSSVTVYGRLDLALEANSNGSTNRTAIQNFSSRLGFKGDKAFSGDLKGIFQLETGVAPDDSGNTSNGADPSKTFSKPLGSRNSFVGLSSASMGSLIVGNNDMPLKSMEGTAIALWGEGDLQELIIHGKGSKTATSTSGVGAFDNIHTRKTNVLVYTSPKFADVVAKLAYSPDEASVAAAAGVPAYAKNMIGASLYWDNGTFNAGYAYQSLDNAIVPTATTSGYTLTGNKATVGMKMSNWSAGVAMSTIDNGNTKKTNNWIISGAYIMGQTTLKASYGASSESASGASDDLTATAIEADYAMDKDFTLYTYYAVINNSKNARGTFAAADNFFPVVKAGDTPTALGFGIRYNF